MLICPDKFAGTLSAPEAAAAIAAGWRRQRPDDELATRPLADGGPGFLDSLAVSLPGRRVPVATCDPLGRPADGEVLVAGDTAYVESAQACGLHLVAPAERDVRRATSYGLGLLLVAAVEAGARAIIVGLGGSATNDAGGGMLAAVGAAPLDETGYALPYGGAALANCASLAGLPQLRGAALVAATDVDNPLTGPHGASAVFGPQKGATSADVALLDSALAHFADVLERELASCPPGLAAQPGAGAAGGLGAALQALGGRRESGLSVVRTATGLDAALDQCDLVITGEGSFDTQSLRGKVVAGVAQAAAERRVPCLVLAGQVTVDPGEAEAHGVTAAHAVADHVGGVEAALSRPADGLSGIAAAVAGRWND